MRATHPFAIVAAILVAFGLKLYFFSPPAAANVANVESARFDRALPVGHREQLDEIVFV